MANGDLAGARKELETQGYRIISENEERIVAVRQKWHLDCVLSKLTWVVCVRKITGTLTAEMLEADRTRLNSEAKALDPSALPRGFQKGMAVLPIYLADNVDSSARMLLTSKPRVRFAWMFLPAARDAATGEALYLRTTPIWGAVFFGKMRHIVKRLLTPDEEPVGEPLSVGGAILTFLMVAIFAVSLATILGR